MKFALALLLAAGAALAGGPAWSQKIAPGLWEHSMTLKADGGEMAAAMAEMQKQLAALPPDQRKMMQEMMGRQGVNIGATGQAITVKVCLTPEQAARDEVPPPDGDCRITSRQRTGNTLKMRFECTGEHTGSGEGEYTFISDKAHKGRTVINTTAKGKGKPERMEMLHAGKWLSANCGTVKPVP